MIALPTGLMFLFGQPVAPRSDADQISRLITTLSSHTRSPSDLLDPSLNSSERAKNLSRFSASPFELTLRPTEGIPKITGDSVAVPVRVHYSTKGNYLDADATAHFVKRDGTWYFSDYDFLSMPIFLIVAIISCVVVGIAYAAVVLVLWRRALRRERLGLNAVTIFIPFFWPVLFRQTRTK